MKDLAETCGWLTYGEPCTQPATTWWYEDGDDVPTCAECKGVLLDIYG